MTAVPETPSISDSTTEKPGMPMNNPPASRPTEKDAERALSLAAHRDQLLRDIGNMIDLLAKGEQTYALIVPFPKNIDRAIGVSAETFRAIIADLDRQARETDNSISDLGFAAKGVPPLKVEID